MRRIVITGITLLTCFILQSSVFHVFKLANTAPNIMIIFVCSIALMRGQKSGMIAGFFSGLLLDVAYGSLIGGFAFLYMLIGFVDGFFHHIYYSDDGFLPLLMVGINDLVYGLVMYLVVGLLNNHRGFFTYLKGIILPEVVFTLVVAIFLNWLLTKINDWLDRYDKGSVDYV